MQPRTVRNITGCPQPRKVPIFGCPSLTSDADTMATPALMEEAARALDQLRATVDPQSGNALESPASRADVHLVAAALAVRRSEYPKGNGEPNYLSAARAFLPDGKANSNSGTAVKSWCEKLSRLHQIQERHQLAASIDHMDDQEFQLVADDAPVLPGIDEDSILSALTILTDEGGRTNIVDADAQRNLIRPPDDSPPVSVAPSPPYTATESATDDASSNVSLSSSSTKQYSASSQKYVPPHLRGASSAARPPRSLADLPQSHQPQSAALTSANVSSLESGPIRSLPDGDDAHSVATSAVTYISTLHSRERRDEYAISQREIRAAIKHGWRDQRIDGARISIHFEYEGVVAVMATDMKTLIETWRRASRASRTRVHSSLVKTLDTPDGEYLADSAPMSATHLTEEQATVFMRVADKGCQLLRFPDVVTMLLDFGCGCLEQALHFSQLAEPCWTLKQLAGALARVREQDEPHSRMQLLLSQAVAGAELPEPFPWAARFRMGLDQLREAMDACGGSVVDCGTDMVNRNLLHLYSHIQDEAAVQLLMERGGASVIDRPNVHGRMPIFSAAGVSARDASKATRLTQLLCEAKCSVDWTDQNGRNILHHAVKKPLSGRLEVVQLLLSQGANPHERDLNGVSPAELARTDGHPLVADLLSGQPVCMIRLQPSESAVRVRLQVSRTPVLKEVYSAGLVVYRRCSARSDIEPRGVPQFLLLQSSMGRRQSTRWTPPMGQRISSHENTWLMAQEFSRPSHGMPHTLSMARLWTHELTGLPEAELRVISDEPLTPPLEFWDDKLRKQKISVYFLAELTEPYAELCLGSTSGRDQLGNAPAVSSEWLPLEAAKERAAWKEMVDTLGAAAATVQQRQ